MQARIKWVENRAFLGQTGSGHAVLMDGATENGGQNLGPRPMEMLLLGAGGCSAYDVVTILEKSRAKVEDCVVEINATRADTDPKVFTQIHMHFIVSGEALKSALVERAIKMSAEKYCSATIMLGHVAKVTHDFEVIDTLLRSDKQT